MEVSGKISRVSKVNMKILSLVSVTSCSRYVNIVGLGLSLPLLESYGSPFH